MHLGIGYLRVDLWQILTGVLLHFNLHLRIFLRSAPPGDVYGGRGGEEIFTIHLLVVIDVFVAFSENLKVVSEISMRWGRPVVCKALA